MFPSKNRIRKNLEKSPSGLFLFLLKEAPGKPDKLPTTGYFYKRKSSYFSQLP